MKIPVAISSGIMRCTSRALFKIHDLRNGPGIMTNAFSGQFRRAISSGIPVRAIFPSISGNFNFIFRD